MRILFLCKHYHTTRTPARLVGTEEPTLREGGHQWVRALAAEEGAPRDILFDMRRDSLADIAAQYPGGPPDVLVVWEPGYLGMPRGIEDAPFPLVACYSDWNLVNPHQAGMLDTFDWIFTDRPGVRLLRSMGHENAEFWPMWGHDPHLSRTIPGVAKQWDIGMVGNLNADVQRERAPWLARVASLADRYRVRIAGGLYGEDYTRAINATKITFNRSIRGEMNMRCYEAAASGSLLFYEEENEEIRDFFQDRVHCVLYNGENLEALLEHYLTHDDERERIVAAARERVAEISYPRNLNRLAERLEALDLPSRMDRRKLRSCPVPELRKRQARQSAGWETLGCHVAAREFAREAAAALPNDPAAHNDFAVVNSLLVPKGADQETRMTLTGLSLRQMRRAVELAPASAFFRLNLAQMYEAVEEYATALEHAQAALALLDGDAEDPSDPLCLPFPFEWNEFRIQNNRLYNLTRERPEELPPLRKVLLMYRAGMLVGRLAEKEGRAELAVLGYRIAAAARPDLGTGRTELARLLAAQGETAEAIAHVEAGLSTDPFITAAWPLYARLLLETAGEDPATAFIERALTVLSAVAPAKERWAMTGAVLEMDEVRRELMALVYRLARAA